MQRFYFLEGDNLSVVMLVVLVERTECDLEGKEGDNPTVVMLVVLVERTEGDLDDYEM